MDESLYDSLRWLDEDVHLDLSLDNYGERTTNSSSCLSQRRKSSFRRTLSFNSVNLSRKSTLISRGRAAVSTPSTETQSVFTNIISRRSSISRPPSQGQHRHASQLSTSSIDPCAQHYQDPEARLKLRVYLASPQKFDEAIEFGFPALKDKETRPPKPSGPNTSPRNQGFLGTFLDDQDDASIHEETKEECPNISLLFHASPDSRGLQGPLIPENKRQSRMLLSEPDRQLKLKSREMTLRMTLTRPDLRNDSFTTPSSAPGPTNLLPLSPTDDTSYFLESDTDDQSLIKKMWHKLRRWKN